MGWTEVLRTWLRSDSHRAKRERRTAMMLFQAIRAQGYAGGYGRARDRDDPVLGLVPVGA
jgi:hypothetical protein